MIRVLAIGAVVAANFLFFGAMKRIDAAPASVAASVAATWGNVSDHIVLRAFSE